MEHDKSALHQGDMPERTHKVQTLSQDRNVVLVPQTGKRGTRERVGQPVCLKEQRARVPEDCFSLRSMLRPSCEKTPLLTRLQEVAAHVIRYHILCVLSFINHLFPCY